MPLDEETVSFLEEQIPELAVLALRQAYWQALTSGNSVLEHEDGVIYETFPNGTRKVVKVTGPPLRVVRGEKRRFS
jgi:hypothetical protein